MRASFVVLMAAALAAGSTIPSAADYTGPRAAPDADVAKILQRPKDDQKVLLQGRIVRQVGPKRYVFSDGTGEIEVKISDKKFPAQPIDDKVRVEIAGEVEKDFRKPPHIDVDAIRVLANEP